MEKLKYSLSRKEIQDDPPGKKTISIFSSSTRFIIAYELCGTCKTGMYNILVHGRFINAFMLGKDRCQQHNPRTSILCVLMNMLPHFPTETETNLVPIFGTRFVPDLSQQDQKSLEQKP